LMAARRTFRVTAAFLRLSVDFHPELSRVGA